LKIRIAILLFGLLLSVSRGAYHPSFTSFSGFDTTTLADVVDDACDYCGDATDGLVAIYQDLMAPVKSCTSSITTYCPDRNPVRW
jgi:hypothetical protein